MALVRLRRKSASISRGWVLRLAGLSLLAAACGGRADEPEPAAPAVPSLPAGEQPANPDLPDDPPPAPESMNPEQPTLPDQSMILTPPPVPVPPEMPEVEPEPEEPSSVFIESCTQIGGYDRIFVYQRDDRTDVCTFFGLVTPSDEFGEFDLASLSLPDNWTVENMEALFCRPGTTADSALSAYTRAVGSVVFSPAQGGLPSRMKLDVVLSRPDESLETPPDEMIAEQRIAAEDLVVLGSCQGLL